MENKRKAKIRNEKGELVEVDIASLCAGPLLHTSLDDKLLERIDTIYEEFQPYLEMTQEQFEIGFMRDNNPEKEVELWEDLVITYRLAQDIFGKDEKTKETVYCYLIHNSVGSLTEEEEQDEAVKQLQTLYSKVVAVRRQGET